MERSPDRASSSRSLASLTPCYLLLLLLLLARAAGGMKMMKQQQQVALLVAALLVLSSMGGASAATCSVSQLAVCAPAISSGSKPTSACCSSLKGQQSCFCQYIKNPALGRYVNSPNAKKTLASCGIAVPRC